MTSNRATQRHGAAALATVLALAIVTGDAQQPAPQRAAGVLKEGVTAVLVDVVVRDRRGQPVRDLTAADFDVLEDGVAQTIGSFTSILEGTGTGGLATPAPAAPAAPAVAEVQRTYQNAGPGVIALVFDRLTPEARRLAVQAAQGYLGAKEEAADYIGIFGIDLSMAAYAPFTRNTYTLRQSLTQLGSRASAGFNSPEQQQQKANADQQAAMAGAAAAGAQAAGGPGAAAAVGGAPGEAQLAQMQSNMIRDFQIMERDQQGYATTNGLFAIISTLGRIPGRKSLVLFSEGIAVPTAVHRLFLGVIDAANRANVSIYTMDAAGLRAESDLAMTRDRVNAAAGFGATTGYSADAAGGPYTRGLEGNEESLRRDPRFGLGTLAQDTGGLLFNNTNNLRQGFERVESDLRNYYLVGYTPSNDKFDGRFRAIEVKVKRPGLTVAARKGYFAVRDPGGVPVNTWEAPALGALEQKPVPNAFPVRAAALLFPERGRPGLVPVVVDLKTAPLTFLATDDGKTYSSDFTVLVRFLDGQNQVARKVSEHYEVRGPIAQIERAKQGEVIFYRESELPAGLYTMETVVYDAPSGKSSVRFSTVEVPKSEVGQAAHEQPHARQAEREVVGEGPPLRQPAPREGHDSLAESRRAGEQGIEGTGLLFRRVPGPGRAGARIGDRAPAEQRPRGAAAHAGARRRC